MHKSRIRSFALIAIALVLMLAVTSVANAQPPTPEPVTNPVQTALDTVNTSIDSPAIDSADVFIIVAGVGVLLLFAFAIVDRVIDAFKHALDRASEAIPPSMLPYIGRAVGETVVTIGNTVEDVVERTENEVDDAILGGIMETEAYETGKQVVADWLVSTGVDVPWDRARDELGLTPTDNGTE